MKKLLFVCGILLSGLALLWLANSRPTSSANSSPSSYFTSGDFRGDGFSDYTVFRNGVWYVLDNPLFVFTAYQWGIACDIPIDGDFDGDGRADLAVFRATPGNPGNWYVYLSSINQPVIRQWGQCGDKPVPGDYNGDGRTDMAVWRPGTQSYFHVLYSPNFNPANSSSFAWGVSSDLPPLASPQICSCPC